MVMALVGTNGIFVVSISCPIKPLLRLSKRTRLNTLGRLIAFTNHLFPYS